MELIRRRNDREEARLRKLIEIERGLPGIFKKPSLCGREWLLQHALDVSMAEILSQEMEIITPEQKISLTPSLPLKKVRSMIKKVKGE